MRNLWNITRRELGSLFLNPVTWLVTTLVLVAFGAFFSVGLIASPMAELRVAFFNITAILVFAVPMLTMKQLAEERRSGTIETLCTAPVTDTALVLGKFLGALLFFLFLLLPTLAYVVVLFVYSSTGPDKWILASSYLGLVLTGLFMLSVGLFASSLTRHQLFAAVSATVTLLVMWLLGTFLRGGPPAVREVTIWTQVQAALYHVGNTVAFGRHFEPFTRGTVDTREIVFFLSFTAFFLFLTVASVSSRKWR